MNRTREAVLAEAESLPLPQHGRAEPSTGTDAATTGAHKAELRARVTSES